MHARRTRTPRPPHTGCTLSMRAPRSRPNRGPVVLSIDEVDAILDCLPPPRKESEGEDAEEKAQIKTLNTGTHA